MCGFNRKKCLGLIGIYVERKFFVGRKLRRLELNVSNVKRNSRILSEAWIR